MSQDVKATVAEFFEQFKMRTYNKGQILILSDDITDQVYFLLKGRVKVYDVSSRGDQVVVNSFKPGAFFPLSVVINNLASPAVVYDLLGRVYKGTDGLMGRLVQLASGNAQSRLAYELIVEVRTPSIIIKKLATLEKKLA